ncbi:hypothetical protein QQF64_019633 [Cirrhinus molitorella]|uniref:Integrase catalytic domain-containing protein n=1 Tax=Cirrhinus molitorella TaxID=172907 RepID=A0ABR3LFZ8_9TELE
MNVLGLPAQADTVLGAVPVGASATGENESEEESMPGAEAEADIRKLEIEAEKQVKMRQLELDAMRIVGGFSCATGSPSSCHRCRGYFTPFVFHSHCFSCVCSICGKRVIRCKPNQVIARAPLSPIPVVGEAFEEVLVDCVGPLPKTKAVIQTDQGTNFLSRVFSQTLKSLSIKHRVSSAHHPESQGVLERFHQTLKSMLRKYCLETSKDWDEGIPLVLFAVRESVQESLGFSRLKWFLDILSAVL